ncbi:hypothetical protein TSUD_21560 [Trifolium subterraneum]|uniref:Uncharacterized protein n=1 Tax=Trifolium subterraneum TaxID=3900 RepID=A0A2Z6NAY0_TRISU|nr:hypothetical protein TSUD_21560 [Trifolium subterraneum]
MTGGITSAADRGDQITTSSVPFEPRNCFYRDRNLLVHNRNDVFQNRASLCCVDWTVIKYSSFRTPAVQADASPLSVVLAAVAHHARQ